MKFVILLFWLLLAFAKDASYKTLQNRFVTQSTDPKEFNVSVLDQDDAEKLFNKFKGDKSIPFKYPIDGCYARANVMARMAAKNEIIMGKIFAEGDLRVKTNSSKFPSVNWCWHVAPVLYVKTKVQNKEVVELMVFDPSLFNKPVPVEEWKKIMEAEVDHTKGHVEEIYYGSKYQYYPSSTDKVNKKAWTLDNFNRDKYTFKQYHALQDFDQNDAAPSGAQPQTTGAK